MIVREHVAAGSGSIHVTCPVSRGAPATLTDLSFCYPLKLISPRRSFVPGLQCVYMLSYGGGLVAGDSIDLSVHVDERASLVLLTQGSTKVFKHRIGRFLTSASSRLSRSPNASADSDEHQATTRQTLDVRLSSGASLFLLPAPVTCFKRARYAQKQTFELADDGTSNLVVLDWYTSGRSAMRSQGSGSDRHGLSFADDQANADDREEWSFDTYGSTNIVFCTATDGERTTIAHDALLLKDDDDDNGEQRHVSKLRDRMSPYTVYATVFLFGPRLTKVRARAKEAFERVEQYKMRAPYSLVWSYSDVSRSCCTSSHSSLSVAGSDIRIEGGVARCAAVDTEAVKDWICDLMGEGMIELIGKDLWQQAFA